MKRLFVLVNMQGKKLKDSATKQVKYFDTKDSAKKVRNQLNDEVKSTEWRVSRGPDNVKSSKPHRRAISGLPKYQRGNRGHVSW